MIPSDFTSTQSAQSAQINSSAQTCAKYGQRMWEVINNNRAVIAGAFVLSSAIALASAQPIQQAATWSLSCCYGNTGNCRTLLMPFNNVTLQNVIRPLESLIASRGQGLPYVECSMYNALVNHGSDFSTFTYNVVKSEAPALAVSVAATVATVALNLLM